MLGCMLKKVPSMTTCPCQEDNSYACVKKDEDALKVWQMGEYQEQEKYIWCLGHG